VTPLSLLLLVGAPFAALALHAGLARRSELQLRTRLDELAGQLEQLQARLEVTERDLALALSQTGVAEGLLLEKGIADADEVEDMRRRLVTDGTAPGDGEAVH
jgi:hypothetical protein